MKSGILFFSMALMFASAAGAKTETAILAGGCFWGMEEVFRKVPGVTSTQVGYEGGSVENPTYEAVSSGKTGHAESIQIQFDPGKVTYESLLKLFFRMHDPTSLNRQGNDVGTQYRSEIFYLSPAQKKTGEAVMDMVDKSGKWPRPIATKLSAAKKFYPAEENHQKYLVRNPNGYNDHFIRDFDFDTLARSWNAKNFKKPTVAELKKMLTPKQFSVSQNADTEEPFKNEYYNNHEAGIYVDRVSGEPLFSSLDKFESGTGWPSFTKPLRKENIVTKTDKTLFSERTEVRSKYADSHLGHVFDDGPAPEGKRYCMNSASLLFIPAKDLKAKGYGEFAPLFENIKK